MALSPIIKKFSPLRETVLVSGKPPVYMLRTVFLEGQTHGRQVGK
jgi:hypothetical protein